MDDRSPASDGDAAQPQVHERWWWTGTFRAVLGAIVVGYQWQVIATGEAGPLNWVLAAAGGAVALWGVWLVRAAWQRRQTPPG